MKFRRIPLYIFACILAFQVSVCVAETDQARHPYLLGGLLPGKGIKEAHVGARLGSYKPDLHQLDNLLKPLGISVPGAATMYNAFVKFKGSPQLSYLVEAGYWQNEESTSINLVAQADSASVGATFTHLSFSLLYSPEIIREYVPLYLGIGGGIAHMKFSGGILELLLKEREDTGASGNVVAGLEYEILKRVMVDIQAKHIFKSFSVEGEEEPQEFSFDGTVVSIGVSARF